MAVPHRALRHSHEPQLRPHGDVPRRPAVIDVRAAARDRVQGGWQRAHLLRRQAGAQGRGPRRSGPDPHRRGRRGHGGRPTHGHGSPDPQAHRVVRPCRLQNHGRLKAMHWLTPLPVAIPLIVAAAIAALSSVLPRRLADWLAIFTAVAVAALCIAIFFHVGSGRDVYWFSGWKPAKGIAIGVAFTVDRFGAGMAVLVAALMVAALTLSWHFFDETLEHRFPILMLVFLGAMVGFSLSGDLFNMFVFFELMGVAAYALTGYKVETRAPLQGALNFAISNSVAGYLILLGIALVYARTGALNLAQLGRTIGTYSPDGLIAVGFTLLTVGLLVKAAIVPFHFWLADAHAVAPTPVCVLFSGAMVELGLYGVARVYWTVFASSFAVHADALSHVLVGLGVLTALVGAVMCFAQQHVKRLLAFSTVSHMGLFLVGVGLLERGALGGVAIYVAAHGAVKAALFVGA